jgi:hypothetical protein
MSDTPTTPGRGGHAFPPPPPPTERSGTGGCLKFGLIGCGALLVLVVVAIIGAVIWFQRNEGSLGEAAAAATRAGARIGLTMEEEGCLEVGASRASGSGRFADGISSGAFLRGCLEFSAPTPGFCEDVPPPTAIRRTVAWQQERCAGDAGCQGVIGVVQTYCTEGRHKRTAADTLEWERGADAPPHP